MIRRQASGTVLPYTTVVGDGEGAVGRVGDLDRAEGVAVDVGVVAQHAGGDHRDGGVLVGGGGVVLGHRGVVDGVDGDGHLGLVGEGAGAVLGLVGEGVGAVEVGGMGR